MSKGHKWMAQPSAFDVLTCISSSRMVYTGKERRCCPMVFSREKALAPSAFLLADSAFIFAKWALNCPCERWPPAWRATAFREEGVMVARLWESQLKPFAGHTIEETH
eukprot:1157677-Pelagomonas_calceolata.AAC.1